MTVDGHGDWQGPHMDPIGSAERRVANRFEAEFVPFIVDGEPVSYTHLRAHET